LKIKSTEVYYHLPNGYDADFFSHFEDFLPNIDEIRFPWLFIDDKREFTSD